MVSFKEPEWIGEKQCFFLFASSFLALGHKWGCGPGLEARNSVGKLRHRKLTRGVYFFGNPRLLLNAHNSLCTEISAENDLKTKSGNFITWGEAQKFFFAQITAFYFNLMSEIWQDNGKEWRGSIKVMIFFPSINPVLWVMWAWLNGKHILLLEKTESVTHFQQEHKL